MIKFPPRTILVALDFSGRSFRAWDYAEALAGACAAKLEAIHVHEWTRGPDGVFLSAAMRERQRQAVRTAMARLLGRSTALRVTEGDLVLEILKAARACRADMILMATEGRTGPRGLAQPSVTEAVARASPIPVLSLRRGGRVPGSILVPLNLKGYAQAGFRVAEQAARVFGAELALLHVREPATVPGALARLEALADSARPSVPVELEVVEGESVARIVAVSRRHDLVVMVVHRKSALHDAAIGTTAEQVLRLSPVPVLCIPAAARRLEGGDHDHPQALGRGRFTAGGRLLARRSRPQEGAYAQIHAGVARRADRRRAGPGRHRTGQQRIHPRKAP